LMVPLSAGETATFYRYRQRTILTDASGAMVNRITLLETHPVLFEPDTIHFSKPATLVLPDGGFVAEAGDPPGSIINFSEVVNGQVVPD